MQVLDLSIFGISALIIVLLSGLLFVNVYIYINIKPSMVKLGIHSTSVFMGLFLCCTYLHNIILNLTFKNSFYTATQITLVIGILLPFAQE